MDKQQILDEIESLKKKIDNPSMPESAKNVFRNKIEKLKANLETSEKKEEKVEAEVKKEEEKKEEQEKKEEESQDELEKTIKKAKAVVDNKSMPESAKKVYKKKLDDAEAKLKKIKKEAETEKKKEVTEKKAERKKRVRATPPKERVKKVKEAKKKSVEREKKIKRIMSELEELVEKSKKLKSRYSGKGVDLDRDAARRAKPFGYRYKGKHNYRTVSLTGNRLKKAIKEGRVYKETRPNKADSIYRKASKKTYPLLEQGGMMKEGGEMAKGGLFKDSRYNYGRSWKLDHARHNKSEDYEIPMNKRKKK